MNIIPASAANPPCVTCSVSSMCLIKQTSFYFFLLGILHQSIELFDRFLHLLLPYGTCTQELLKSVRRVAPALSFQFSIMGLSSRELSYANFVILSQPLCRAVAAYYCVFPPYSHRCGSSSTCTISHIYGHTPVHWVSTQQDFYMTDK